MPSWREEEKLSLLLKYKSKDLEHCTVSQVSDRFIHGVHTQFMHGKGRVSPLQKCHAIKGHRKKQPSTQYLSRKSMRLISFRLRPVYFQRKVPSVNTAMFQPVHFRRKAPSVNVTMKTWKRRSRIQALSTSAGEITDSAARIILQMCSNRSVVRRARIHRVTTREKLGTHPT
jgi:hypothetical protein